MISPSSSPSDAPVHVLFCAHSTEVSGAEISLLALLSSLDSRRFSVALACPPGQLAARATRAGIAVVSLPIFRAGYASSVAAKLWSAVTLLAAQLALLRVCARFRPAILHANSLQAGLIATPARVVLKVPLVVHVRDVLGPGTIGALLRLLLVLVADRVIAISQFIRSDLLAERRLCSRTLVVYNGVDQQAFDPNANQDDGARAQLGLSRAEPLLGIFGQITPWKGQLDAIEALPLILAEYPNGKLLIVGSAKFLSHAARYDNAAYLAHLQRRVESLGLTDHVVFAGERDDVPALMRLCDVILVPSWAEPFGRVTIEAMAMAKPVIATAGGGSPELVTPGGTGLLVPPRDSGSIAAAVLELAVDPGRRHRMGAAGRMRALTAFTIQQHAAAIEGLYHSLLGADPG